MRYLVLGSLGRRISWTLVTALLLPLLALAMPMKAARAQQVTTTAQRVAVLDFGVLASNVRSNAIVGRNATDAVVVEMSRSGQFDVEPRSVVAQQVQELGLTFPLNNNGIQRLGRELGVRSVVTGDVTNLSFVEGPKRARVTVSVRVTDVISGELINGAIATGYSQAAPAGMVVDDETLVNQALTDAAFNAVKTINDYTLPEATILQVRGTEEATLNKGARDGLVAGQEMVVVRGGLRVGKIRVGTVDATDSVATVLDFGRGIQPQDRARAVFKLPGYNVTTEGLVQSSVPDVKYARPTGKKTRPILITALLIVAAVFLATLLFDNKSRTLNATGIGKVVGRAYASGSVPAANDPTAARVELTWEPASDIPINNILEYHIFRDGQIIGVTTRNQKLFTDLPVLTQGDTVTYRTIDFGGNTGNPFPGNGGTGNGNTGTTTGGNNNTTGGNNNTTGGGNNAGGNNNGQNQGPAAPTALTNLTATITPLTVGVPHVYSVRVLYQQVIASQVQGGGGGVGGGGIGGGGIGGGIGGGVGGGQGGNQVLFRETELRASSGRVTPVARPGVIGPTTGQDLRRVKIAFQTVQGADQYVFEFSTEPNFRNKVVRGPFFFNPVAGNAESENLDLSGQFGNVPNDGRIYFRVGARSSLDEPGPIARDTPNGGEYIYATQFISFTKIGTPPNPPAGQ